MDERRAWRFTNHIPPGRIPAVASITFHRQPSFVLLSRYYYVASPAAYLHGTNGSGWRLEAPHDDLLFISQTSVQSAGIHLAVFRDDWTIVHAAWNKLHYILCSNLHSPSFGTYRWLQHSVLY